MTTNSVPKLLDTLRPQLPEIAGWVGVTIWVAREWQMANRQPKPDKRAKLVKAARKHVARVLALVEQVEREGKAQTTKRGK